MINPEHYQILAARLAIDLMRTEPQKRLPYMTENLRELILQLNKPSPNYPDDQAYAQKREDMKNAGNLLWQKLNALTEAMISGAPANVHKQALTEASAALERFDRTIDHMLVGRSHEQFLLDSAAHYHCGSVIKDFQNYKPVQWSEQILEQYYPAPGSGKEAEPLDNDVRTATYLNHQLKPDPYVPGNAENILQDQEPAPPIAQQLEQNARPKTNYWLYREGLAADTQHNLKTRLAAALAVVELEGKGVAFDGKLIAKRAKEISQKPGFEELYKSKKFVTRLLREPEKMSTLYKAYEERQYYAERNVRENYNLYMLRHKWMDIPKGKEKEYLAKLMACQMLWEHKEPFSKSKIHSLAESIQKDREFKKLTRNPAYVRMIVEEGYSGDVVDDYRQMELACFKRRWADFQEHPEQLPEKSWERYLTEHLTVPPAGREVEYLAKVIAAQQKIRRDSPNSKFSVKTARAYAAKIQNSPIFRELIKDPDQVSQLLQNRDALEISLAYTRAERKLYPIDVPLSKDPSPLNKQEAPQANKQGAAQADKQILP